MEVQPFDKIPQRLGLERGYSGIAHFTEGTKKRKEKNMDMTVIPFVIQLDGSVSLGVSAQCGWALYCHDNGATHLRVCLSTDGAS